MARKKHNRRQDKAKKAALKPPAPNERRELRVLNAPPADLDLDAETKWFLLFTAPRVEGRVAADLAEAGCSTFWPSEHRTVTRGERVTFEADVATFPRYLFASGPLLSGGKPEAPLIVKGRPIASVFDIEGLQIIVSDQRGWVRVPNAAIAAIARYQSGAEPPKAPPPAFQPGSAAVITAGPFMTFQATIVEAIGLHEARVLIDIFGGQVPATVGIDALRAA